MTLTTLAAGLFTGLLIHNRASIRAARVDESMWWLWTKRPESRVEQWARYTFYLWLASCLILLAPIEPAISLGITTGFAFVHVLVLVFR